MTPKTAPWFVHYGCEPGLYPDENFVVTTSIHKPTQTPFIAGPLAARQICTELTVYQDFANAQARVLQPIPTTVPSLQNTCFFAYPDPAI
jgi:hypothetical protein